MGMMFAGGMRSNRPIGSTTVRRVAQLFASYRPQVVAIVICVLISSLLGLLPFNYLGAIVDKGLIPGRLDETAYYSILTIIVTVVGSGLGLYYGYLSIVVGQHVMRDLRNKLFEHLQAMSLKFFSSTRVGEIQTRLISDVSGVQSLSATLSDALASLTIVVSCLIYMIILDWRLMLLSIGLLPVFAILGQKIGGYARTVTTSMQTQMGGVNSLMSETLSVSGVLLTKTSGRRQLVTERFHIENETLSGWQAKAQMIPYYFFGLMRFIFSLAPATVYWFAAWLIFRGDHTITLGKIVQFTALQSRLFFPLTSLLNVQIQVTAAFGFFDRIFEYLDLPIDISDRPDAIRLDPTKVEGRVEFRDVSFSYEDDLPVPTLQDINFKAESGQLVALVGPSGAGKTTLTYLIPRLYDVATG